MALTRMISAVFRRGGDVTFVVEELKAVFDPRGGQWMGGRYVPSLLAAIGEVIERHLISTEFMAGQGTDRNGFAQRAGRRCSGRRKFRSSEPAHVAARQRSEGSKAAIPACPAAIPNVPEYRLLRRWPLAI